ncbi:MAG: hypothetical protein Q9212_007227 [Teloschistes hypoglaucus]
MAARREDRFLMRQRGAGARDIQLSFDLEIPGLPKPSRSPLKPQKSAENRQLPPADLSLSLKPPQTPNGTVSRGLSSFKSLVTAKKLGSAVPNPDTGGNNHEPSQDNPAVETVQQIKKAKPGRKRKIVPAFAEDNEEISKVNSPRTQNSRLLTGQSPSHTALQIARNTEDPTNFGITGSETVITEVGKRDATELAAEQNLEQLEQTLDITKTKDHVREKQEVPKESKTRKRKPIEQAQRPKKKPKVILPDLQEEETDETAKLKESLPKHSEDVPLAAEAEPSVQEPIKHARPKKGKKLLQTSAVLDQTNGEGAEENLAGQASSHLTMVPAVPDKQPKKPGRKPKILVDENMEPVKDTTQDPVLNAVMEASTTEPKPKKRGRKPKNLLDERMGPAQDSIENPILDAVTEASTTEVRPKKRGRKPKIVPIDEVEPPADQHKHEEVVNSGETHEEVPLPQKVQPQSSEGLPATKRKAEKKENASRAQKSRKQTVTVPPVVQLPRATDDGAEDGSEKHPVKTKAARKPPCKVLSKETLVPPTTIDTEPCNATSDEPPEFGDHSAKTQIFVPKTKRGDIEKEPEVKVPKKRGRPKKIQPAENEAKPAEPSPQPQEEILEVPDSPKPDLDQDIAAPIEPPNPTEPTPSTIPPQPANEPEPKKKRGRPKKQPPTAENTTDSKSAARPTKTKTKAKPKSSTIPHKSRVAKTFTTVSKNARRLRPTAGSYSYKDSHEDEDEDEGNASDDPISEILPVGPPKTSSDAINEPSELAPGVELQRQVTQTQHHDTPISNEPRAPHLPLTEAIATIPAAAAAVVAAAVVAAAVAPHPQSRARNTELSLPSNASKEKDRLVEAAAAKIRKGNGDRLLATSTTTSTTNVNVNNNRKKLPTTTRGLENFVFSRVGGRKAKAQAKGEGEELDPELQGLFDQVKGISSRGGGGVRR